MTTPPLSPLLTDLYQLTMLAGYHARGLHEQTATFDLFVRRAPFGGTHLVWAGLSDALAYLEGLRFEDQHLAYLDTLGLFRPEFLEYLRGWRFRADVTAFREGAVVFPHEPLLTVTGALGEAQLVETALLNILNFQTLIATKASRCVHAAQSSPHGGSVVEFGARRAQGPNGALFAARAAFVGGATGTSNVEAGQQYGIPVVGTHAHAWVEAFDSELDAFRAYARTFPDSSVLLLDTYDTLRSGVPNAVSVARELRAAGHELRGVRLDSGDLAYLSQRVRAALDAAGFEGVRILASNDLDEHVIDSVIREGGRIDVYGVGTKLATGGGEDGAALGGVYKLVQIADTPKMKLTADRAKSTVPGRKHVWRARNAEGCAQLDVVSLDGETPREGDWVTDPTNPMRRTRLHFTDLTSPRARVFTDGRRVTAPEPLTEVRDRAQRELAALPEGTTRLLNPHVYRVGLSRDLHALRDRLIDRLEEELNP